MGRLMEGWEGGRDGGGTEGKNCDDALDGRSLGVRRCGVQNKGGAVCCGAVTYVRTTGCPGR
jgi:hypothetical protein